MLRKDRQVVSGQSLSDALDVSRVTVWKHIKALKDNGYDITATAAGYRLTGDSDIPFDWEFEDPKRDIHYHERVGSTMEMAMELARNGRPSLTVVVAGRQDKGRGRLQRSWCSDPGGLYFSVVLRPEMAPIHSGLVNLAAAVDLAAAIEQHCGVRVDVKWPNDLLAGGRKLAGILSQMEAEPDRVQFINVGIGLNVHNDLSDSGLEAVNLAALSAAPVSRKALLAAFLDRIEARLLNGAWHKVVDEWKDRSVTLGRPVTIQTVQTRFDGQALDVDESGALVIQLPDGQHKTVTYGDCFHR